jgi:hypothetical protein
MPEQVIAPTPFFEQLAKAGLSVQFGSSVAIAGG